MACLRDIKRLFADRNPFYAGFGNRLTDGLSYRSVEIPSSRIFTIDSKGKVKLELLELAGYSSSYIGMTTLVDETFPPVQRTTVPTYNDFNFWRVALPEIELPAELIPQPASPALSARSDSSRMSVFRIIGRRTSRTQIKPEGDGTKSPTVPSSPRSTSPSPLTAIHSSEEEDEVNETPDVHERSDPILHYRTKSESMPGSFEDRPLLDQMRDSVEIDRASLDRFRLTDNHEGEVEIDDTDLQESAEIDVEDLPDMDFTSVPYL